MLVPGHRPGGKALTALLGFVLFLVLFLRGAGQDIRSCRVLRVTDGDTFVCDGGERVRMLSIDTPEMDDEPWGAEARTHLLTLLDTGMEVGLEIDVEPEDQYGRTLAWVHLPDGRIANQIMARDGYAQTLVVPPNVRFAEIIREAVTAAREEGAGLWSEEDAF